MGIDIQWPLVLFTLVAGIGGGLLVPVGAAILTGKANGRAQFIASVASLALLVVGGCFSLLHLAAPQNVMAAVFNVFSFSGISLELILLGVNAIIALVLVILLKREVGAGALKVMAVLGIIAAVLLLFFCGHGYVMPSRPAWDTDLLPLAYLGTSLAGGAFAYGVILAACKPEDDQVKVFKLVALICSIVCAAACAAYGVTVMGDATALTPAVFWGGLVLFGVAGALVTGIGSYLKAAPANLMGLAVAGLVVAVIAILAVRVVMWDTSVGYLELFALASIAAPVVP